MQSSPLVTQLTAPTLQSLLVAKWCRLVLHSPQRDVVVLLDSRPRARNELWGLLTTEQPQCTVPPGFVHDYSVYAFSEADLMPAMVRGFIQFVQLRTEGLNLLVLRKLTLTPTPYNTIQISVRYEHSCLPWRPEHRRRLYGWHHGALQLMRDCRDE